MVKIQFRPSHPYTTRHLSRTSRQSVLDATENIEIRGKNARVIVTAGGCCKK